MEAWKVARRMKLSVRALDEVRDALVAQRRIEFAEFVTGGRPTRQFRLIGKKPSKATSCSDQKVPGSPDEVAPPTDGRLLAVKR
jgi:hypothetical protein